MPALVAAGAVLGGAAPMAALADLPRVEPPCSYDVQITAGPVVPPGYTAGLVPYCINNLGEVGGVATPLLSYFPFTWSPETGFEWVPLPPGVGEGKVVDMNDNGWLLVQSHVNWGGDRGFIVPPEGRATAQWIEIPPQGATGYSFVRAINNDNVVVGHRTSASAPPGSIQPYVGFVWSPGTGLVDVAIDAAGNPSSGLFRINDAGMMLGWSSMTGFPTFKTVTHILDDDEVVTLDSEVEGAGMLPAALATSGVSVVTERVPEPEFFAMLRSYVVRDGVIECELPVLPPQLWALVAGVNSSGVAVGESVDPGASPITHVGTVWFDGVPYAAKNLPGFPPGPLPNIFSVYDINEKGQMVGWIPSGGNLVLMTPNGQIGDLDCDGLVGPADLATFLGAWGQEGTRADWDGSGIVDGADLGLLLAAWSSQKAG
jgi:hypothetical protein